MSQPHPVPLSPDRHGRQRWRRFTSYAFAAGRRSVPVVLAEIGQVAAAMPVVFARGSAGVEVLGLLRAAPGGDSAYVSPEGLWLAAYVPSLLRVHPFSARPSGDGRMLLLVDEASGLVLPEGAAAEGAEQFFGADGQPSAALAGLVEFFRQREASALRTADAATALDRLELLVPMTPAPDIPAEACLDLLVVDRARFDAVSDADHAVLRRCGALELAHAHLTAVNHLAWLARAEALRDAGRSQPKAADPAAVPAVDAASEFIAAFARAGQEEGQADPAAVLRPAGEVGETPRG